MWCNIKDVIIYAFDWSKTNEGLDFWLNINSRWTRYYANKEKY